MARSIALASYLGVTALADGWARRKLLARQAAGKEDPERIHERFGQSSAARPEGPIIWFHAASVGESLSVLELLNAIGSQYPQATLLVTTGTRSSAELLAARMPPGVLHQYVPVDTKSAVRGFLDHWRPDLAVWTESEFWPRLMDETHRRGIPMLLVNGRISDKTKEQWKWIPGMSRSLLSRFDLMQVQTQEIANAFQAIGAVPERIVVSGSLKEGSVPLPHDSDMRKEIQKQIGTRPVWFAGSTHEGEERAVIEAHKIVRKQYPELLLILAPRHPERAKEIEAIIRDQGEVIAIRSEGAKIAPQTSVYVADTLGEMGLWYRVSPVSFVGGSLAPVGGHNPFEPAALGSAILHGPHVHNFADIYARLAEGNASRLVKSTEDLANAVAQYLRPEEAAQLAAAAWEVSSDGAGVTDRVLELMRPYLDAACAP